MHCFVKMASFCPASYEKYFRNVRSLLAKLVLLPLLAPTVVSATPAVEKAELNLPSSTLTLSGQRFGTRNSAFALSDSIDEVHFRKSGSQPDSLAYDDLWQRYGTDWAEPLVPRESRSVAASVRGKVYYGGPGRSNNSYYSPVEEQNARSLYVAWLYNPSENPGGSGGSNKFIRIWDDHDGNGTRISWTQMHMTYSGSETASWNGWEGRVKDWNLMEIYVDADANTIKTWVNGKLGHNINNFLKKSDAKGLNVRQLGFDPSIGENYRSFELEIDNVYVADSPARVVISHQDQWEAAQLSGESVIPAAWNQTEIVVDLPESITENIDPFYVFVVDADRNVNKVGYRVCPKCPHKTKLSLQ